jgi:hypothetical protein
MHRIKVLLPLTLLLFIASFATPALAEDPTAHVLIHVDQPGPGALIDANARVTGWAIDTGAAPGAGLDTLHVYLDGPAGQGRFMGGSLFLERPDVASSFGRPDWSRSGFQVALEGMAPGPHTLYVYAFDSRRSERPVQTVSLVVTTRRFPLVEAPTSKSGPWCVEQNPACGRDVWWAERNELQRDDLVEYRFVPGLVTEARFVEAIYLLWQWPEGEELLKGAGEYGVRIISSSRGRSSYASYSPQEHQIRINRTYAEAPSWMVAEMLAHELTHAADDRLGGLDDSLSETCAAAEGHAYQVQARYTQWIYDRMGGPPTQDQVELSLRSEERRLFSAIQRIWSAPDQFALAAGDYHDLCTEDD